MKIKPQTDRQIDFVFSQPLSVPSNASINYRGLVPADFDVLKISIDRGGNAKPHAINLSFWGDENKRVLGIRVWDSKDKVFKEDHREYDKNKKIVKVFSRGEYQKANPRYRNTHHT